METKLASVLPVAQLAASFQSMVALTQILILILLWPSKSQWRRRKQNKRLKNQSKQMAPRPQLLLLVKGRHLVWKSIRKRKSTTKNTTFNKQSNFL